MVCSATTPLDQVPMRYIGLNTPQSSLTAHTEARARVRPSQSDT